MASSGSKVVTAQLKPLRRWVDLALLNRTRGYKQVDPIPKWNIMLGDKVQIIAGKYAGDQGKVVRVNRQKNMVAVEGTKVVRRAVRASETQPGGIISFPAQFHYSKVALVDPVSGKPTKVSLKLDESGQRVRVSKASGAVIPRPKEANWTPVRAYEMGPMDTPFEEAKRITYQGPEIVPPPPKTA